MTASVARHLLSGVLPFRGCALYSSMSYRTDLASPAVAAWGDLTDEEAVRQILAGDTPLFELLMRRHNERLYRAARAITRDDREAEDVMQQAYVNAFASLRQYKGQAQFSTWLTRIAINEALARVQRRGKYQPLDVREVEGLSTADTAASLGVSEDVVKTRLSRARSALRAWLLEHAGATTPEAFRFHRPRCDRLVTAVLRRISGAVPMT